MSLYSLAKTCWRGVVPLRTRQALFDLSPAPIRSARRWLISKLEKTAEHNELYDGEYYAELVDPTMALSADAICASIINELRPRTLIDVGCGTGLLMKHLREKGVECRGIEYSEAAIATCRRRGLEVLQMDIEHDPIPTGMHADVVVSTEVAEHLPESCAEKFVDLLTALGETVVLTAAQASEHGSTDHVNEQPMAYWIAKMERRGYAHDAGTSDRWRESWRRAGAASCFFDSVMLFRKEAGLAEANAAQSMASVGG